MQELQQPDVLEGQPCPMCLKKTLTLTEAERDIPYFGKVYVFSMTCMSCKYHKADLECVEKKEPCKYTLEISSKDDLNIRVVKSATATVKVPFIMTIESGQASNGYITNVEGVLNRMKRALESTRDNAEDATQRKKVKNMLKKLYKVMQGAEKIKMIIEDKTGNSAIVSEKAERKKIKG